MTTPHATAGPFVSIIIDNYNYGRFLREAIDSALAQTYGALEVIVVDDGSTDDSLAIIRAYGDRIIPVLQQNGGQAAAFNAGFTRSRGDLIIFLDADDVLRPDVVQRVSRTYQAQPGVAKIMYRMEVIDADSLRVGVLKPAAHLPLRSGDLRQHVLAFPFDMTWLATSGNAFSARVLRQIFPIPAQAYGRIGADWYLAHLTPLFGPVICLAEVGAAYRVHGCNRHEVTALDLAQMRQTIKYMKVTGQYIQVFAKQLGLSEQREITSVSYVANRLVSLKLDPSQHPLETDSLRQLVRLGWAAARLRFDVSPLMKLMFDVWFVAMAVAPHPIAQRLATVFFFPEKRGQLNRLLGKLHKARRRPAAAQT